jgi:hypothetical protein
MTDDRQQQRRRKRLLVASIGVATVSFMSLQTGCQDEEPVTSGNLLPVPIGSVKDPALAGDAAADAATDALVTSGNLVAPPPTTGNLLPPAPIDAGPKDAALDALIVSGNLVAPPRDAAADASDGAAKDSGQARDARIDTGIIPPSGNLVPAPPFGSQ